MSCWVAVAVWAQALHWDPVWLGLALGPRRQRTNTFIGSKRFSWGGHRTIVQQTFTSSSLPSRWGHLLSADQGACPEPLSWPRERAQAREQASRRALPVRGSRTRPPVVRKSRRGPGTEGLAGRSGREATRAQLAGGRTLRLHTARDRGGVPGRAIRAGREKRGRQQWGDRRSFGAHGAVLRAPGPTRPVGRSRPGGAEAARCAEATRRARPAASALRVAELCLEPRGPAVCGRRPGGE